MKNDVFDRENEARLTDFANASAAWFWETDAEHRYTWFSGESELQVGVSLLGRLGITRMEVAQLAGADLGAEPWSTHLKTIARREPFQDFVCHYVTSDNDYWLSVSGVPRFDASKRFLGYRASTKNITQQMVQERQHRQWQVLANAALLESETSYRMLVELSPEPIGVHRDGQVIYVNPAAVRMLQAGSAHELIGRSMFDLVLPEFHPIMAMQTQSVMVDSTTHATRDLTLRTMGGALVDVVAKSIAIRWNAVPAILVMANDVTAQVRERRNQQRHAERLSDQLGVTESNLRESEKRLALAADSAGLGFWARNLERDEVWASERWRAHFGFGPTQRIDAAAIMQRIHPQDRSIVADALAPAMHGSGRFEVEHRIALPDDEIRWISSVGNLEFDATGKPQVLRGVSLDITTRKTIDLEMRQKRREVEHLSRVTMLGELSGSLAHELNQPLTAILSNAQAAQRFMAQDSFDLQELREIMQDIVDEDKRAGEVIRRLRLLLATGEQQQQTLDVNELVSEVFKLLRSDLVNHGIALDAELGPELPMVAVDRVQLQQVMINLMVNACDAMRGLAVPQRRLAVRTSAHDGGVRVSVIDQGCGIAADVLEQVFQPFYTTKEQGMGLGLSICRNIVSASGGRLWCENNPGLGAVFHFSLPRAASPLA